LARKPLQLLGGEPLIVRVWQRAQALGVADEIVVATDAPEIQAVVERAGGRVLRTSAAHQSGTERVAEVAAHPDFTRFDIVLNLQGDEPFLPAPAATGAVDEVRRGADVGTAAAPLDAECAEDPGRVKVVIDRSGRALYFSRAPIPSPRDRSRPVPPGTYWQHLGVYAYGRETLERWVRWEPVALERIEQLEQLRALYHGLRFGVTRLDRPAEPGIDTPGDLLRAESLWPAYAMGDS
jgi:3-deoxy-manno-octulosonate cytidylyltransferase (CMP-KDO synthetase)